MTSAWDILATLGNSSLCPERSTNHSGKTNNFAGLRQIRWWTDSKHLTSPSYYLSFLPLPSLRWLPAEFQKFFHSLLPSLSLQLILDNDTFEVRQLFLFWKNRFSCFPSHLGLSSLSKWMAISHGTVTFQHSILNPNDFSSLLKIKLIPEK